MVYAGGSDPYNLERQMRDSHPDPSVLNNPGNIAVPGLDEQIEKAARQTGSNQAARG